MQQVILFYSQCIANLLKTWYIFNIGPFNETYYSPINADVPFVIDKYSGSITVMLIGNNVLDFEGSTKEFSFAIEAKDNEGGKPSIWI